MTSCDITLDDICFSRSFGRSSHRRGIIGITNGTQSSAFLRHAILKSAQCRYRRSDVGLYQYSRRRAKWPSSTQSPAVAGMANL